MFISASKLKRRFRAKGRYYRIGLENGVEVPCRSTLEIFRKGYDIEGNKPNALFVMMNPGGSTTLGLAEGQEDGELYSHKSVDLAKKIKLTPLCDAKPDRTQYQVMRIMEHYNWNYVRVLNLSDIRDVDSADFIERYRAYDNSYFSIFSNVRYQERMGYLQDLDEKPIIAAWGISPDLEELALAAIECLPRNIKGLQGDSSYKYLHPLPRKWTEPRKWLQRFLEDVHLD
ncbi:hypothetical protein [Brevibacillus borstelensis]|uniref:hypothetical protein n=1 Tax=Brevibacillus borstelensis TaxID=45462 RepID=UPI002E23D0EE|nr:hypothetical protein [Brevibacillus borstelensis]